MVQEILVILIFLVAVAYTVRFFWRQAKTKSAGCSTTCGCEATKGLQNLKKSS
ncbi:MAG: FeoB-associated Cys-rich membrane protein [Candidatus Cyclobacteriaceae bacterium M2_1C_046]